VLIDIKHPYVRLYAPTSLEQYMQRLGGKDEWVKRRPQR
jgi:hypothetical protein